LRLRRDVGLNLNVPSRGIAARQGDFRTHSDRRTERCPAVPIRVSAARVDGVVIGGSVKQTRLRWGPTGWQPDGFCAGFFLVEVGENLLDHGGVLYTGNDPQRPAAGRTGLDVDAGSYVSFFFRLAKPMPASPIAMRTRVEGSGTVVMVSPFKVTASAA